MKRFFIQLFGLLFIVGLYSACSPQANESQSTSPIEATDNSMGDQKGTPNEDGAAIQQELEEASNELEQSINEL